MSTPPHLQWEICDQFIQRTGLSKPDWYGKRNDKTRNGNVDAILGDLYTSIAATYSKTNDRNERDVSTMRVKDFQRGDHFTLLPPAIQTYLEETPCKMFQADFVLPSGRHIHVFVWGKGSSTKTEDIVLNIHRWLHFLDAWISNSACSKELFIYLYLTPFRKQMPKPPRGEVGGSREVEAFQEMHVNSAFTFTCRSPNEIYIYREEEWQKVLIHETMHTFGMDFSAFVPTSAVNPTKTVQETFPGVHAEDLRVFESYTEFWAEILVIMVHVYQITKKSSYDKVRDVVHQCLYYELAWSLLQCNRVFSWYNISYTGLLSGKDRYDERESPVFSYFVLKTVLLIHLGDVLDWCCRQRRTEDGACFEFQVTAENVSVFCTWLQELCTKGETLEYMRLRGGELLDASTTMRMSLWGGAQPI